MTTNPTRPKDRIVELDIFRGFAILGIFMVNILVMNVSFAYRYDWEMEQTGWLQRASFFFLENLFYAKFFTIFSFLFGLGVALQIQRSKAANNYSIVFFLRRFGALFLFGVCHILFIWSGDVLHLYALLGFLLLFFFRLPPRVILWSAIIIFSLPFYTILLNQFLAWLQYDNFAPLANLSREDLVALKHSGSYWSGMQLRIKEYQFVIPLLFSGMGPIALSMMLLGGYLVKKRFLENIPGWLQKVKWPLFITFITLLAYRFIDIYWIYPTFEIEHGSALSITLVTLFQLSDIATSLFFLWIIAWCWNKGYFQRLLSPLQYVGRMAFTNYIFQSIMGYLVMRTFNGYEQFSPFECILLVLGIYTGQVILSKIWLTYYRIGPLEWLWRCISYAKRLPFQKVER